MKKLVRLNLCISLFSLLFLISSVVWAGQEEKKTDQKVAPGPGEVFVNIGQVVVQAEQDVKKTVDLPGSVDILGKDQIEKEVTDNSLELLRRIPGFVYRDYGNGGVPSGFTMRGFNSNHGSDNLVLVDGIPINDHFWQEDGAPDFNQLTSEEIDRMEVIKGPIDARYGNWARAGIVNVTTRTRGNFFKSHLSGGDWNTKKAYVSGGSEHFDNKFNQVYSVESYSTNGWRDNSERERQNAYAKWYFRPGNEKLQLGMQTHVYQADWYTGSYITEDQWKENPRQAAASSRNDGGNKDLSEISLHLDWDTRSNMPVTARLWFKENTGTRYADWGGGQTESYCNEDVYGLLTNIGYNMNITPGSQLRLESGMDFRDFDSNVQNWQTDARVRQSMNSSDDYTFRNLGLYAKANYDPIRYIRLFTGIRHDSFSGDTTDLVNDVSSDMDTYDVTTYKGGIIGNISDRYSLYANIGTAYTLPRKELKYAQLHPDENDLLFWETGAKAQPIDQLLIRYAYFNSEEDVIREVMGEYVSEGNALRKGHEIELSLLPVERLELFSSITLDDSKYDGGANDGRWITSVPKYIWKAGVQYDAPFNTGARVWYTDVGKWYTDTTNANSYEGFQTVDLTIYHKLAKQWKVSLDLKNLLDENYAEYVGYWSGANQYMSSNPRGFYLSFSYET